MGIRGCILLGVGALALLGCKRDADQPLPAEALYPDASPAAREPTASGPLQRIDSVRGREPDDRAAEALRVPAETMVLGELGDGSAGDADQDWIVVEPLPPASQLWRAELKEAPDCARLELYGDPSQPPIRTARPRKDEPAALPALSLTGGRAWLRVRCVGGGPRGSYRLLLSSRPARPEEEREPNDEPGPDTRLLGVGAVVQATLAPEGDVDVFRLDLSNALPGDATLLSVTSVPGLQLVLELRADGRDEPLLRRTSARGEALLIPNLDVRRTGPNPLLRLHALRGARVGDTYAATVRPLLPAGCRTQGACPERIPVEREPNDSVADAMGVRAGGVITGLIDNDDDVDVYAIDGEPGQRLRLHVDPPKGVRVVVSVAEGADAWAELSGAEAGAAVAFPGRRIRSRRVYVTIRSTSGSDRTAPYTLEATLDAPDAFEHEGEARTPLTAGVDPSAASRGIEGCLLPPGDIDVFGYEVTAAGGPRSVLLRLRGDGAPGLSARLRGPAGTVLATVMTDGEATADSVATTLPVGSYDVVVDRAVGQPTVGAYRVEVMDQGPAALPEPLTPTTAPSAAPVAAPSINPAGR